jgi:CsoR family transcriptional regulator, copper-sensing transcriptional repressor
MRGYYNDKDDYLARLRRVEGQIRGLQRMVDEDQYCIDILTQISAVNSAPKRVAISLLDDRIRYCVVEGGSRGAADNDMVGEATAAIARLVKS